MDILQILAIVSYPALIALAGWSIKKILERIYTEISDVKSDIRQLRTDVGEAINNTGIVSEELIALEKQCKIRHKER